MSKPIKRCPECDAHHVTPSAPSIQREHDDQWYCGRCGAHFDDPKRCEQQHTREPTDDKPRRLLEADPDDYPK